MPDCDLLNTGRTDVICVLVVAMKSTISDFDLACSLLNDCKAIGWQRGILEEKKQEGDHGEPDVTERRCQMML